MKVVLTVTLVLCLGLVAHVYSHADEGSITPDADGNVPTTPPDAAEDKSAKIHEHSWTTPLMNYDYAGNRQIPGWTYGGSTALNKNFVRLTPDRQSRQGWLFNTFPNKAKEWAVVLKFRVSGSARRLFGDGMAFWYTKMRQPGPVLGGMDRWTGLGVFFDTFQNTDKKHYHQHPYVSSMTNDGRTQYSDDTTHWKNGCHSPFRFHEGRHDFSVKNSTAALITYQNRKLTVAMDLTGTGGEWTKCVLMEDADIPTGYYFGLTASTGHLADNHDILGFTVHSLDDGRTVEDVLHVERIKDKPASLDDLDMDKDEQEEVNKIVMRTDAMKEIMNKIDELQHDLEHQLSAVKENLENAIKKVADAEQVAERRIGILEDKLAKKFDKKMEDKIAGKLEKLEDGISETINSKTAESSGWKKYFYFLTFVIVALCVYAWRKYKWLMKRHLL
eukprot:GFYU01007183.1.p1 GENE.GFYU01007183.1~~GFYU01007183.1.p1  ORF type:complete len:444 (-),score=158.14 GFYU01007183.1:194-1525(-)